MARLDAPAACTTMAPRPGDAKSATSSFAAAAPLPLLPSDASAFDSTQGPADIACQVIQRIYMTKCVKVLRAETKAKSIAEGAFWDVLQGPTAPPPPSLFTSAFSALTTTKAASSSDFMFAFVASFTFLAPWAGAVGVAAARRCRLGGEAGAGAASDTGFTMRALGGMPARFNECAAWSTR